MSKTRYIPLSPKEIMLYKREKLIEESHREDKTNRSLIALRKTNLSLSRANPELAEKVKIFNIRIKSRPISDVVKVINYLMSDFSN